MLKSKSMLHFEQQKVAAILACLPRHIRIPLIKKLQQFSPNIGAYALRFEDLVHAEQAGFQLLIDNISPEELSLAMLHCSAPLQKKIFNSLTTEQVSALQRNITQLIESYYRRSIEQSSSLAKNSSTYSQKGPFYELEMDSLEAQAKILVQVAEMRHQQQMVVEPPGIDIDAISQDKINQVNQQLQAACEAAMARQLSNYSPELASAVLCRRLDRDKIIQQMLQSIVTEDHGELDNKELEQLLRYLNKIDESNENS